MVADLELKEATFSRKRIRKKLEIPEIALKEK
jgi:hypothetical protein